MIVDHLTRSELRRLARKGKLIDEAFKAFQRTVYANAGPDQVREMRACFFAGAAELVELITAAVDDTSADQISDDEEAFAFAIFAEVSLFHERTVNLAFSKPEGSA